MKLHRVYRRLCLYMLLPLYLQCTKPKSDSTIEMHEPKTNKNGACVTQRPPGSQAPAQAVGQQRNWKIDCIIKYKWPLVGLGLVGLGLVGLGLVRYLYYPWNSDPDDLTCSFDCTSATICDRVNNTVANCIRGIDYEVEKYRQKDTGKLDQMLCNNKWDSSDDKGFLRKSFENRKECMRIKNNTSPIVWQGGMERMWDFFRIKFKDLLKDELFDLAQNKSNEAKESCKENGEFMKTKFEETCVTYREVANIQIQKMKGSFSEQYCSIFPDIYQASFVLLSFCKGLIPPQP